jgi:3-oxoacyl-[acyl-carrier protein] reductase
LAGHTALVTGANHGIGAATSAALAARGASVFLSYWRLNEPVDPGLPDAYRHDRAAGADAVVDGIRAAGGRAAAVETNLADSSSAPGLFDAAEAAFGQVDILINNAGAALAAAVRLRAVERDEGHGVTAFVLQLLGARHTLPLSRRSAISASE